MRRPRRTYGWIGWGLLCAGLVLAISVPARFLMLEAHGQQRLLRAQRTFAKQAAAESGVNHAQSRSALQGHPYAVGAASGAYRMDGLIGLLQIPSLALAAPLAQGTTDQVLSSAVGHLVGSSLPGQLGDSLLAAHNATWFRHIDRLHVGDIIWVTTKYGRFTYRVTGSQVVHTGAPVAQSASPMLILESCYPLDALYLTPYRQLVFASLVSSDRQSDDLATTVRAASIAPLIPSLLLRQGVTLQTVSVPMGTLRIVGHPTITYTESSLPLELANAAQELYVAWLRAAGMRSPVLLQKLLAASPARDSDWVSSPVWGETLGQVHYASSFDVTIRVSGTHVTHVAAIVDISVRDVTYQIVESGRVQGRWLEAVRFTWQRV